MLRRFMLRGFLPVPRHLLVFCLSFVSLLAARAEASPIPIDDFSNPTLATRTSLGPNGLGQILPFASPGELAYLGDLLGMHVTYTGLGDLTVMSNGALALEIVSLVPSSGPVTLEISVNGGAATISRAINTAGPLLLAYTDFDGTDPEAEFANVATLRLDFHAKTSFAFAARDLQAVPEPATGLMLSGGLLGLAFMARRAGRSGRSRASGVQGAAAGLVPPLSRALRGSAVEPKKPTESLAASDRSA
jgi:hypothetical protein